MTGRLIERTQHRVVFGSGRDEMTSTANNTILADESVDGHVERRSAAGMERNAVRSDPTDHSRNATPNAIDNLSGLAGGCVVPPGGTGTAIKHERSHCLDHVGVLGPARRRVIEVKSLMGLRSGQIGTLSRSQLFSPDEAAA